MKRMKSIQLLTASLLIFGLVSGCGASRLVDEAYHSALAASRYADEAAKAQAAARAAQQAGNLDELTKLLNQADEAAKKAAAAAEEARALQQSTDDPQLQRQIAAHVGEAEESAQKASSSHIDVVALFRTARLRAAVDEISSNIVQRQVVFGESSNQKLKAAVRGIVTDSWCETMVEVLNGKTLSHQDVIDIVTENIVKAGFDFFDIAPGVASDIISEVNRIWNGEPEDELKGYKDACEEVLAQ